MTVIPAAPPSAVKFADSLPKSEAGVAAAGAMDQAARGDHVHARLTSADNYVLDANGYADVTFTRTFAVEPAIAVVSLGAIGGPVPDFSGEFVKDVNGIYVGIRVYGERKKALPLLTGIVLIGPLISALTGFKPWEPASGAKFSLIALVNPRPTP